MSLGASTFINHVVFSCRQDNILGAKLISCEHGQMAIGEGAGVLIKQNNFLSEGSAHQILLGRSVLQRRKIVQFGYLDNHDFEGNFYRVFGLM